MARWRGMGKCAIQKCAWLRVYRVGWRSALQHTSGFQRICPTLCRQMKGGRTCDPVTMCIYVYERSVPSSQNCAPCLHQRGRIHASFKIASWLVVEHGCASCNRIFSQGTARHLLSHADILPRPMPASCNEDIIQISFCSPLKDIVPSNPTRHAHLPAHMPGRL